MKKIEKPIKISLPPLRLYLYELNKYNVKPSFGEALADPSYEPLSVNKLIDLKKSNVSPETIRNLRKPKVKK